MKLSKRNFLALLMTSKETWIRTKNVAKRLSLTFVNSSESMILKRNVKKSTLKILKISMRAKKSSLKPVQVLMSKWLNFAKTLR